MVLLAGIIGATVPFWSAPGQTQSRNATSTLELWPGQRVVLVLPLTLGADWNAEKDLGEAILNLVQPEVGRALARTGKFSPTLPYRFDPILRRAVIENRVSDADITTLIATPTLQTAQPILTALSFDQPAMVADVKLEELRVGGTAKTPTVQLQMSGRLYDSTGNLFRTIAVTSRSFAGKTPQDRLSAAASQGLAELANRLVDPPDTFALPLPPTPTPGPSPTARPSATNRPSAPSTPSTGTITPLTPVLPGSGGVIATPPNSIAPSQGGADFVPQLPPAQPPLGLAVPDEPVGAR
jgi:hypothetical protein